jgi:hypothetical protein
MSVTSDAFFIQPHKYCVVVFLILIYQLFMSEMRQHISINKTLLDKVSKHTAHIRIGLRQCEVLSGSGSAFGGLVPLCAGLAA